MLKPLGHVEHKRRADVLFSADDPALLKYEPPHVERGGATGPDDGEHANIGLLVANSPNEGGPPSNADGGASEAWLAAGFVAGGALPVAAQQVVASAAYPWSTVVLLTVAFPNGTQSVWSF